MAEGFALIVVLAGLILAVLLFVAPLGIWMTLHRIEDRQKKDARELAKQTQLLSEAVELLSALVPEEEGKEG